MASQVIATILRSGLNDPLDPDQATITEFECLASYSWLESDVPTISVPGFPPIWSPPVGLPIKLEQDSGRVYIDQNAARIPNAPLEPIFSALAAQNPDFNVGSVDVVTDRNNIRKLLRFLGGTSSEPFQIQAEIIDGKRIHLTRVENEVTTVIQGFQGYGRNFEKACTKNVIGASGYYRITSCRFGGLKCVIRHETDAYIGDELARAAVQQQGDAADSLSHLVEKLHLVDPCPVSTQTHSIIVKREGREVDSSSIVEIKTRAASKNLDMNETAAQLWISQTPHLATAYHKYGLFNEVKVQDMTEHVRNWEKSNQKVLCGLVKLLNRIIQVVRGSANQVAIVSYEGGMKLEVISREQEALSGVSSKFQGGDKGIKHNNLMAYTGNEYKILAQTNTISHGKTKITIGSVAYEIDVSRIPRLAALVKSSGSTKIIHTPIPLFDVALKGIESGYRQCFRLVTSNIRPYRTLCDTYDYLLVDVCKGRTLSEIIKDLKAGQYYDEDRDKSKARDAAFKLVYSMLRDTFQSNEKHKNTIFNAVLFVVSHPGTFKWRTRNAVRAVYEDIFVLSEKQRANFDRWHKLDYCGQGDPDEDDETTEEDSYFYDSDYSDF